MQCHYFTYMCLIGCITSNVFAINKQPTHDEDNATQQALCKAIFDNSVIGIKQAVQAAADINFEKDGQSPLALAAVLKRTEALETLLACGAQG